LAMAQLAAEGAEHDTPPARDPPPAPKSHP
jgi:hypothetical protein